MPFRAEGCAGDEKEMLLLNPFAEIVGDVFVDFCHVVSKRCKIRMRAVCTAQPHNYSVMTGIVERSPTTRRSEAEIQPVST
jgi:hypothetical protein